jgi:hypothetical protein
MAFARSRWTCPGLAAALLVASAASAQEKGRDAKAPASPRREAPGLAPATPDDQRASGVIVKAEPLRKETPSRPESPGDRGTAATHRLTINTAVVWRDWTRDQGGLKPDAPPREVAERGANSVATKGEPRSEDTLVVVDVVASTRIETRFRATTDETGKGSKTPAAAREAAEDPATEKGRGASSPAAKAKAKAKEPRATRFLADDLKPGLFVEADYRRKDSRNVATAIDVIRPVGGPDDVPAAADRAKK